MKYVPMALACVVIPALCAFALYMTKDVNSLGGLLVLIPIAYWTFDT